MSDLLFADNHNVNDTVPEVSVDQVQETKGKVLLIDVRTPEEWVSELGHIDGSELKTLGEEFEKYIQDLDKEKEAVIVCRSGKRSAGATMYMREQGFTNIYNMTGGMIAWNEKTFPTKDSV